MKIDLNDFQAMERAESFDYIPYRKRGKRKHKFIKILLALVLALLTIGLMAYLTLKFIVGPIVQTVDSLPADFPAELALDDASKTQITLNTPASRQKLISGLKAMPDWVLTLFLNFLSDDLKEKLADNFGDNTNIPKDFTASDLKKAIKATNLEKIQTVNIAWEKIDKTKEEIAAYYKEKLAAADFQFKENLSDYQINLGFWKNDIFGIISFIDKKEDIEGGVKYNTQVDMTVNYLNDLKK
ncbi:MAG: hypothetical protein A3B89_01960 [Candidatus Buchananbacteria bacterium RIFCSPHIGHO2_02_FULL_40_13]|uniref:Uncharacterized protein n=1 Tax=Candidatus Buchananbacteria bacterium RIFCSPLOWO2_01_FULL_39_33 TaxID=1797543 RepID=A0A1G1YL98_9BACT|nr:MAG: hypothetical protein A3B89_01960 [Candidatus Buchananbacteria bacterium RIFCSPHIGHO2_02_FULL_40_13]OGY53079.1 MAG: hypothetical protein A3A02_04915 [Candidatus Buchananbacteria bacterium RIFCSPLOWO2_01_FULL_39_33]